MGRDGKRRGRLPGLPPDARGAEQAVSAELDALAAGIRVCPRCRLSASRTLAVPGEGPDRPLAVLVGEAPGQAEDLSGRPFTGRTGLFLDRFLQEAGLDRAALFITAAVKCRPPANRDPRPDELTVCREAWLLPQLALLAPAPVVLLGRAPARSLLGHTGNLADVRGRVVRWRGRALLATVHPTAAMRFPKMRAALEEDFRTLKALLGP